MRLKDKIKKNKIALLKEYIELKVSLIKEDSADPSGDLSYGDSNHGMYTAGSTDKNMNLILSVLGIRGITDIGRVALGAAEAIITRVFGEVGVIVTRLWHLINPYYFAERPEDLNQITANQREAIANRIGRVNAGYADVLRRSLDVQTRMGSDINAVLFLANPAAYVSRAATTETAGATYNLYHRIRHGGPPPSTPEYLDINRPALWTGSTSFAGAASPSANRTSTGTGGTSSAAGGGTEASSGKGLSEQATGGISGADANIIAQRNYLMNAARAIDSSRGDRAASEAVARTILGSSASEEDINALVSGSSRSLTEAGGAVADEDERDTRETTAPSRSRAASLPPTTRTSSTDPRIRALVTQAQQLNQTIVAFLKSPEAAAAIANNPGVKEGQKALVDIVVQQYRNQVSNLSFESMRSEHPEEFEEAEREARDMLRNQEEETDEENNTTSSDEDSEETDTDDEAPVLFDTEEKRNAFVASARQQLAVPSVAILQGLANQNPELRTAVNTGIQQIQTLAAAR